MRSAKRSTSSQRRASHPGAPSALWERRRAATAPGSRSTRTSSRFALVSATKSTFASAESSSDAREGGRDPPAPESLTSRCSAGGATASSAPMPSSSGSRRYTLSASRPLALWMVASSTRSEPASSAGKSRLRAAVTLPPSALPAAAAANATAACRCLLASSSCGRAELVTCDASSRRRSSSCAAATASLVTSPRAPSSSARATAPGSSSSPRTATGSPAAARTSARSISGPFVRLRTRSPGRTSAGSLERVTTRTVPSRAPGAGSMAGESRRARTTWRVGHLKLTDSGKRVAAVLDTMRGSDLASAPAKA